MNRPYFVFKAEYATLLRGLPKHLRNAVREAIEDYALFEVLPENLDKRQKRVFDTIFPSLKESWIIYVKQQAKKTKEQTPLTGTFKDNVTSDKFLKSVATRCKIEDFSEVHILVTNMLEEWEVTLEDMALTQKNLKKFLERVVKRHNDDNSIQRYYYENGRKVTEHVPRST